MRGEPKLVYITTDGPGEARMIGRKLVEDRLAACANILDPMTSVFRWTDLTSRPLLRRL